MSKLIGEEAEDVHLFPAHPPTTPPAAGTEIASHTDAREEMDFTFRSRYAATFASGH